MSLVWSDFSVVLYDMMILAGIYFLPAISHAVAFPLYLLEPMRIMLFSVLLFFPDAKRNAVVMAATIPLMSFLMTGHPLLLKMVLMSVELVLNVIIFHCLLKRMNVGLSVVASIVVSKAVYYLMKAALIFFGLLNMELVVTGIGTQMIVAIGLGLIFQLVLPRKSK